MCREKIKDASLFEGEVLTLGQQAIYATLPEIYRIFEKNNLKSKSLPDDFDIKNKIPQWRNTPYDRFTNAQSLFKLFGANEVHVADVSPYENPDFLIDLNYEIDDSKLLGRFDTIVDIGTLEHIFDINSALSNIVRLLKVGGKIITVVPASNAIDHGFYSFSPTLFYDYFGDNGFGNFSCYLRECSYLVYERRCKLYEYTSIGSEFPIFSKDSIEVAFIATKIEDKPILKKPFQNVYKQKDIWELGVSDEIRQSATYNASRLTKLQIFNTYIKFYGGRHFPGLLEFARLLLLRFKKHNIKLIGRF